MSLSNSTPTNVYFKCINSSMPTTERHRMSICSHRIEIVDQLHHCLSHCTSTVTFLYCTSTIAFLYCTSTVKFLSSVHQYPTLTSTFLLHIIVNSGSIPNYVYVSSTTTNLFILLRHYTDGNSLSIITLLQTRRQKV